MGLVSKFFSGAFLSGGEGRHLYETGGRTGKPAPKEAGSGKSSEIPKFAAALCAMLATAESHSQPFDVSCDDCFPHLFPGLWKIPKTSFVSWGHYPGLKENLLRLTRSFLLEELPWLRLEPGGPFAHVSQNIGAVGFFAGIVLYDAIRLSKSGTGKAGSSGKKAAQCSEFFGQVGATSSNHLECLEKACSDIHACDALVFLVVLRHVKALRQAYAEYLSPSGNKLKPLAMQYHEKTSLFHCKTGPERLAGQDGRQIAIRLGRIHERLEKLADLCSSPADGKFGVATGLVRGNQALACLLARHILENVEMAGLAGQWFAAAQIRLDRVLERAKRPFRDPVAAEEALGTLRFFGLFCSGYFQRCLEKPDFSALSGLGQFFDREAVRRCFDRVEKDLGWCAERGHGTLGALHDETLTIFEQLNAII